MEPATLEKFRIRLEDERDQLLRAHGRHEQDLKESHASEDIAGPDRAAELDDAAVEAQVVESEERLLEKIVHALERIAEGTYGICENCEGAIPEARLDAKPSVSLCVDCQAEKEAG